MNSKPADGKTPILRKAAQAWRNYNAVSKNLRWPYSVLLNGVLPFGCLTVSVILTFAFIGWLNHRLGIPTYAPIRDQPHGLLWLTLVLTFLVLSLLAAYVVCFALLAPVLKWRAGWSVAQAYRLLFYAEVPPHWLRSRPPR